MDTAEQIYESGKTLYVYQPNIDWLTTLYNPWIIKLANRAVAISTEGREWEELFEKLDTNDSIVLQDSDSVLPPSTQHRIYGSKELITSLDMGGWDVKKLSPWQQLLNTHVLQLDQVTARNTVF